TEYCETDTQAKTGLGGIIGTLAGNVPATKKPESDEGAGAGSEAGGMEGMGGTEGMGDEHASDHSASVGLVTDASAVPALSGEVAGVGSGKAN
ncbi:hypothetical protein LTS18_008669, partial [Coniosporium uncinatum]